MMFEKHFNLEEANSLLPELRRIFDEIGKIRASMQENSEEIMETVRAVKGNGGGAKTSEHLGNIASLRQLIGKIERMGISIKDVDRGLIDFPTLRDGREVFLCWELSEDRIRYWHDIEAGYGGRQPI